MRERTWNFTLIGALRQNSWNLLADTPFGDWVHKSNDATMLSVIKAARRYEFGDYTFYRSKI